MTSRSDRLDQLLDAAFDLNPAEYARFLESVEPEYRQEIAELLQAASITGPLERSPIGLARTLLDAQEKNVTAGHRLGRYKLNRLLGEGGMASVWLAERDDGAFTHQVAVKCLKTGLATPQSRDRFLREQQILAQLQHPNIARLYDAGLSDDAVPYIVMEWVDGVSLVRYCDNHHLGIKQRLELFRKVCAAVAYAHQNLVVHRDLKPGNILVGADGEPKLLDFGIAKLLDESSEPITRTGVHLLTPEYAAPEQFSGGAITTSTDVYALGAILYELLSGLRPRQYVRGQALDTTVPVMGPSEALKRAPKTQDLASIAQSRQSAPDRLRRLLQGDLDTIALKALQGDSSRRYPTVQAFSDDIARYLKKQPILARKDAWTYRFGMLLRRHWLAFLVSTVVFLLLCTSLMAALWQAHNAELQRDDAERESALATEVQDFIYRLLRQEQADAKLSVSDLLARGETGVAASSGATASARALSASVLLSIYRGRRDFVSAARVIDAVSDIQDSELSDYSAADLDCLRASILSLNNDNKAALAFSQRGIDRARRIEGRQRDMYATCLGTHAGIFYKLNEIDDSIGYYQQAIAELENLPAHAQQEMPGLLDNFAAVLIAGGRYEEAERACRRALALLEAAQLGDSRQAATVLGNLAVLYQDRYGRPREAVAWFERALAIRWRLMGASTGMAQQLINFAGLHSVLDEPVQALALLDRAEAMQKPLVKPVSAHYAHFHMERGRAFTALRRWDEAKAEYAKARDILAQLPPDEGVQQSLRNSEAELILASSHDQHELEALAAELAKIIDPMRETHSAQLSRTLRISAQIAIALGDSAKAEVLLVEARTIYAQRAGEAAWQTAQCDELLGELAAARGDKLAAQEKLKSAAERLAAALGPDHPLTRQAREKLAAL